MYVREYPVQDKGTVCTIHIVEIWDAHALPETTEARGHTKSITAVAFAPDGATFASSSKDETVRLWRSSTGEELHTIHHDFEVYSVAFSPDGKYIVSGSRDRTIRVWSTLTGISG